MRASRLQPLIHQVPFFSFLPHSGISRKKIFKTYNPCPTEIHGSVDLISKPPNNCHGARNCNEQKIEVILFSFYKQPPLHI